MNSPTQEMAPQFTSETAQKKTYVVSEVGFTLVLPVWATLPLPQCNVKDAKARHLAVRDSSIKELHKRHIPPSRISFRKI